jgi:putative ABC transport system permease protein
VGSLWAAAMLLRRIRAELAMVLLLFLLVAATSFLFAAAPRIFSRVADDALRHVVREAALVQRDVMVGMAGRLSPGDDGAVGGVRSVGMDLKERFPPTLRGLLAEPVLRVTAARMIMTDTGTYLSLKYQDGLPDATRLVDGRWPVDRGTPLPRAAVGFATAPPRQEPIVLEVAMSSREASELGLKVGDRQLIEVDGSDPLLPGIRFSIVKTAIKVVGLFEPIDATGAYWDDLSLLQAVLPTMDDPVTYAAAYIPPDEYPSIYGAGMPFRYDWRFHVDPEKVDAGKLEQLEHDLLRVDMATGVSEVSQPGLPVMRTGLIGVLHEYSVERARSQSILAIAAVGPFAAAVAALGTIAVLLVMRRRPAHALARGRGAAGTLVLGAQLWEAVLVAGSASLVGLLAAVALIPARDNATSAAFAMSVGAAAILLLVVASWPSARRPLGQLEREDPPILRVAPRRIVIELTIVGIAVFGVVLLRQRGLGLDSGEDARFDPLLVAVPVLAGLAAGIVSRRFFPLPVNALGWLAARRQDLVPVLALRTLSRHPAVASLSLLVLMLTAAFGAFASVLVSSLDRGQAVASYRDVGADYRINQTGIGSLVALDPTGLPGVTAAARGILDPSAAFASVPNQRASIDLVGVDPDGYAAVTAGTPLDPAWPPAFRAPPDASARLGTDELPIPAILSWRLPLGSTDPGFGGTFHMTVARQQMAFQVVGRRDEFPGIGNPASFALVPFPMLEAAYSDKPLRPSVMWVRATPGAADALAASLPLAGASAHITSRYAVLAGIQKSPFSAAIETSFGVALAVAGIYLVLAVIGAMVLSASRRTQDLAYLRILGVTGAQSLGLTIIENAPAVLLAVLPGVALGIGIAFVLEPGLGLGTFVGGGGVPLFVDWLTLGLLVFGLIGVVAVAVGSGTWLARRARIANVLRASGVE